MQVAMRAKLRDSGRIADCRGKDMALQIKQDSSFLYPKHSVVLQRMLGLAWTLAAG